LGMPAESRITLIITKAAMGIPAAPIEATNVVTTNSYYWVTDN